MKLVLTADFHVHLHRVCSNDEGHDRLLDGLSCLRQSLVLAEQHEAVWVNAGDFKVPKNSWPQSALTGSHALLREYDHVPKLFVAGNHDAWSEGGTGLSPFTDCAVVIEKPQIVTRDLWRWTDNKPDKHFQSIICAPWDSDLDSVRRLTTQSVLMPLVAHGFVSGSFLGPDDVRLPGKGHKLDEYGPFSVAFFGDIHKGQVWSPGKGWKPYQYVTDKLREGGTEVSLPKWSLRQQGMAFYVGSPYQQTWGEREDGPKGALLVDFDAGTVELHEFEAPKFRHLDLDETKLERFVATGAFEGLAGDFVRIAYTGRATSAVDKLVELSSLFRSFQVITRRAPNAVAVVDGKQAMHAGMSLRDLLVGYVEAQPPAFDVDKGKLVDAMMRLTQER